MAWLGGGECVEGCGGVWRGEVGVLEWGGLVDA